MPSMVYQVQRTLQEQLRIGESRHAAKVEEGRRDPNGIFSYGTLETYLKQGCAFAKWAKAEYGCNTLAKARPYAEAYLRKGIDAGLSASTLSTQRAAICKLYQCSAADIDVQLPARMRGSIKRSRGAASRDAGFSEKKNADILAFARATGLRRHELAAAKPSQIQLEDGRLQLVGVIGKGGKVRDVDVLPGCYGAVLRHAILPGGKRIFSRVPSHMDVHGCRREYAQAFYRMIARDVDQLERRDRYACRGDKAGVVYDRRAMLAVSRQLGHNRISVIAGHYL